MIKHIKGQSARQRQQSAPRQTRPQVVIEHHSDGFTDVYSDRPIDVIHIDRPHVTCSSTDIVTDDVVDVQLPRRFDGIREPGNRRSWFMPTKTTPADLLDQLYREKVWVALKKFGEDLHNDTANG